MNLFDGLKLRELIKDGEIRTYLAHDPQNSRDVLVHWMPLGAGSEVHALLQVLDDLPTPGRSLILEAGIRQSRMYLITENPPHFTGLKEWLSDAAQRKAVQADDPLQRQGQWKAQEPPKEAPHPSNVTAEFAGLFTTSERALDPAPSKPAPPENAPPAKESVAPPAPPPAASPEPGEFTRMFSSIPVSNPEPASPTVAKSEPGEFTRMFQATVVPPQGPSQTPASSKPSSGEPGEFTRMFQSVSSPPKPLVEPVAPQKSEPGEFTRMLRSPLATPTPATPSDDYFSKPAPKAPAASDPGEFTRIFGKPGAAEPPPPSKEGATGLFSSPPAAQAPSGPGEYTRMFAAPASRPAEPAAPVPAPVSVPKTAAAKPKSVLPLILILSVLAVLALILVFVFLNKNH